MTNEDLLFGIDGIGEEDVFSDDNDELDVQKYLQRALANHVDGMWKILLKKELKSPPLSIPQYPQVDVLAKKIICENHGL